MYWNCKIDGTYGEKQCNTVERSCWCAYSDGIEAEGENKNDFNFF